MIRLVTILRNLVWLFQAHRDLYHENVELKALLVSKDHTIETLEIALRTQPDMTSVLKDFQDRVLTDQPYPDGKVPDDAWLTPGDNDRGVR